MSNSKVLIASSTVLTLFNGCVVEKKEEQKPNIMLIVLDDMGFSDLGVYGSEIRTPNIDALAKKGTYYTRFHASSLSAPSRAMLLTGVDNHQNGFGAMPPMASDNQYLQEGYEGSLNDKVATIGELLQDNGYETFTVGKWHMGHHDASLPNNRGFARSFSLMAGGTSHFSNSYVMSTYDAPVTYYCEDGKRIEALPEDFYSSRSYTDKAIQYIKETPKDKPVMGYIALTAPHDPLHIIEEWSHRYDGVYDRGYDDIKRARHSKQIDLGIIPSSSPYYAIDTEWDSLSEQIKKEQIRKMEIFAAMLEYADYSVGRIVEQLKATNRYENTVFIIMSDNGSNPKEAMFYPGNTKEILSAYDNSIENYGKPTSFISLGKAWAEVTSTPFSDYKTVMTQGGICTPLIISGVGIENNALDTRTLLHVTDIMPTILDISGTQYEVDGKNLHPLYGRKIDSMPRGNDDVLCFEMFEDKAVVKGDWKAYQRSRLNGGDGKTWFLYNLKEDIAEKYDQAALHPDKLSQLAEYWKEYANNVGYIEFNGKMLNQTLSAEEYYKYDIINKQ